MAPFGVALIGFIGVLCVPHPRLPGLTYFFLFFITGGLYPSIMGIISWVGNNLAPSFKRAVGMALLISIGNLGGTVGSNIFLANQSPNYWLGYGFSAGVIVAAIISTIILQLATKNINKKRDLISEEEVRARYTEGQSKNVRVGASFSSVLSAYANAPLQRSFTRWAINRRCSDTFTRI